MRQYTKAFKAFREALAAGEGVQPLERGEPPLQPTFKNPKRAAQYYNVVAQDCRGCKIVAADVIDETNMERWLKVFKKTAKKPRIWGLHNYRDTNKRKGQRLGGTKRLLKAVKGDVWLTETGGIVKFVLPTAHAVPDSESRANRATKRMFALAKQLPQSHQAALHLPLEAAVRRTTASTPGSCAATAPRAPRTTRCAGSSPRAIFNP